MTLRIRQRTHARSHSAPRISFASSSSSVYEDCAQNFDVAGPSASAAPRRVAIVGTGREALALSPQSADEFTHNLSMAVCSSPELNVHFAHPPSSPRPNPNPGPVLRRIASEAPHKPTRLAQRLPPLPPIAPAAPRSKGLPPPPRPGRRRPPPVFVSTLGAPLALAEQSSSPFTPASGRTGTPRSASVPPSAASSYWGCSGPEDTWTPRSGMSLGGRGRGGRSIASQSRSCTSSTSDSELELDVGALDASYDEYDFSVDGHHYGLHGDHDDGHEQDVEIKSPLGGTYFPPVLGHATAPESYSPMSSPTRRRRPSTRGTGLGVRRPLRVQVSVERVAFRDSSFVQHQHQYQHRPTASALPDLEDGIKTRRVESGVAVHGVGGQRATKVSLGKALGRWLKKHT